jgi:hypothetical protein
MLSIWLATGYEGGGGSAAGRIALLAVALLAVGAFTALQVKARSRRRGARTGRDRRYDPADWRSWPPPSWPGGPDEALSGNAERHRPDWRHGYPPGYEPYPRYDPSRSPWAVPDEVARDRGA